MSWLTDPAQRLLIGALDGLSRRQELISANLANVDTPGYQPTSIDFESVLQGQIRDHVSGSPGSVAGAAGAPGAGRLATTDPRHLQGGGAAGLAAGTREFQGTVRNDGNAVDLESEMTALADTQIRYSAVSRLINGKYQMLNDAIGRGR